MSDSDTQYRLNIFLKKLNSLEQFHQFLTNRVYSKNLELFCKKKASKISSFKVQLLSQLTLTGITYNLKDKWASTEEITLAKKSAYTSLDEKKIIAEILKKEIFLLKEFRIILNDFMIPDSIKKMLTNQVAVIRKDITYIRQLQNSI